jgi:hypothetical protein
LSILAVKQGLCGLFRLGRRLCLGLFAARGDHRVWHDADDTAACVEGCTRDDAHDAFSTAAIDESAPGVRECGADAWMINDGEW